MDEGDRHVLHRRRVPHHHHHVHGGVHRPGRQQPGEGHADSAPRQGVQDLHRLRRSVPLRRLHVGADVPRDPHVALRGGRFPAIAAHQAGDRAVDALRLDCGHDGDVLRHRDDRHGPPAVVRGSDCDDGQRSGDAVYVPAVSFAGSDFQGD
ncbi:unnamed protein product [Linum tenue]|uniref:Uncharacterized protein n=1 Tax=Linum tenue TaxID=586396 RepID=A0AAV0RZS1_9ROSI|nr:unnamed protein product [Linum tenue]